MGVDNLSGNQLRVSAELKTCRRASGSLEAEDNIPNSPPHKISKEEWTSNKKLKALHGILKRNM